MAIRTGFFLHSVKTLISLSATIRTVRFKRYDPVRLLGMFGTQNSLNFPIHFRKLTGFDQKRHFYQYKYQPRVSNSFFLQIGCLYPFSCLTKLASRSDEFLSWKYHRIRIFDDSKEPRAISTLGAVESIRSILEHHPLNLLLRRKWWIDGTIGKRRILEDKRYLS